MDGQVEFIQWLVKWKEKATTYIRVCTITSNHSIPFNDHVVSCLLTKRIASGLFRNEGKWHLSFLVD